jgi:hypothetical protein
MLHRSDKSYAIEIDPEIEEELQRHGVPYATLIREAMEFLDDPDVEQMSLARMYIDRGYSENLAYWIVREAAVRRAAP